MNQVQTGKFDMFERTVKCCNDYPDILAANPIFKADKMRLESKLPILIRLSGLIDADNAYAEMKKNSRMKMIEAGFDVCTNLYNYGLMLKDIALIKLSKYSKSALNAGKEEEVLQRCQTIAEKARELLPELMTQRGMPESFLTTFEANIAQYRAIKPEPRSAVQEKLTLIGQLDTAFEEAHLDFTLLSGSVANLKGVANDFITRFNNSTAIIAPMVSSTKIKFDVSHASTKEKLLDFTAESTAMSIKKTAMPTRLMSLSTTHHKGADFIISKEGFERVFLQDVKIKKGHSNTIKVKMIPIQ